MQSLLPRILAVVGTIALVPALIDPLEGGLILVIAALLLVIAGRIAEKPLPKLVWVPLVVAVLAGVVTLGIAIMVDPSRGSSVWVTMIAGNWLYRLAALVAFLGSAMFAFKMFSQTPTSSDTPVAPPAG